MVRTFGAPEPELVTELTEDVLVTPGEVVTMLDVVDELLIAVGDIELLVDVIDEVLVIVEDVVFPLVPK